MSDVFNNDCQTYNLAHTITVIAIISTTLLSMVSALVSTCILARKVAKELAKAQQVNNSEPDVIVVEEGKDLKRQLSMHTPTLTLNSKDLLEYYDKLPDNPQGTLQSPILTQIPRSGRSSRHSSIFPSINEENELSEFKGETQIPKHGSHASLGPSFFGRNSNTSTSAYSTISRKTNLRRMSSQEQVNQLTRFLLLNEDVDLFKESYHQNRRESSGSSRKLSVDYLMNNFWTEGTGTLKKSMTNLTLHSPLPAVMQRKKDRKKSQVGDDDSTTSATSDATLKAEPILKSTPKYIKHAQKRPVNLDVGKNDTLTYRRQRRVGVHFSQTIRMKSTDV